MNKLQKMAMINLGLAATGLLLQIVHSFIPKGTVPRLVLSTLVLIITLVLLVPYFHRRKLAKQGRQQYDEHDRAIHKTALLVGLMSMFMVVCLATLITFISLGPGSSVRIGTLFDIFLLGAMNLFVTESLTIIIKYGWADTGEQL